MALSSWISFKSLNKLKKGISTCLEFKWRDCFACSLALGLQGLKEYFGSQVVNSRREASCPHHSSILLKPSYKWVTSFCKCSSLPFLFSANSTCRFLSALQLHLIWFYFFSVGVGAVADKSNSSPNHTIHLCPSATFYSLETNNNFWALGSANSLLLKN